MATVIFFLEHDSIYETRTQGLNIYILYRFQVLVSSNLSEASADVVELRQPMTEKMDTIQKALVECMEVTLGEVRRQNSMVKIKKNHKNIVIYMELKTGI